MNHKLKPSEARKMRQQRTELKHIHAMLLARAARHPKSWIGQQALDEAREVQEKLAILAMYI